MSAETTFSEIQQDLAARLGACGYLSDVVIVTEQLQHYLDKLNKSLGLVTGAEGKIGACITVNSPTAALRASNPSSPLLDAIFVVRVRENVLLNTGTIGTGKGALSIANAVLHSLHQYTAGGLAGCLTPNDPPIRPFEDQPGILAYDVSFRCPVHGVAFQGKVTNPSISPNGGAVPQTVTLACGISGASIYYTLDGKPPYPGVEGANLYAAPFTVSMACRLRVGATKTGMSPSNTSFADYI